MAEDGNAGLGLPTFITRVESWECDFIGHWNTRFYARSFQMAAESVATFGCGTSPGAAVVTSRHIRFHRELLSGAPVQVRSVALSGGFHDGAVVHLLSSAGRLSATALDLPGAGTAFLPRVPAESLPHALPRAIDGALALPWDAARPGTALAELGIVRPSETDHTGALLFDEVVRRAALAAGDQLAEIGFGTDFIERSGIGRMLVEFRVNLLGPCAVGDRLIGSSRLAHVGAKHFTTAHHIATHRGGPVALAEMTAVAVDMKTRRATEMPDFMRAEWDGRNGAGQAEADASSPSG